MDNKPFPWKSQPFSLTKNAQIGQEENPVFSIGFEFECHNVSVSFLMVNSDPNKPLSPVVALDTLFYNTGSILKAHHFLTAKINQIPAWHLTFDEGHFEIVTKPFYYPKDNEFLGYTIESIRIAYSNLEKYFREYDLREGSSIELDFPTLMSIFFGTNTEVAGLEKNNIDLEMNLPWNIEYTKEFNGHAKKSSEKIHEISVTVKEEEFSALAFYPQLTLGIPSKKLAQFMDSFSQQSKFQTSTVSKNYWVAFEGCLKDFSSQYKEKRFNDNFFGTYYLLYMFAHTKQPNPDNYDKYRFFLLPKTPFFLKEEDFNTLKKLDFIKKPLNLQNSSKKTPLEILEIAAQEQYPTKIYSWKALTKDEGGTYTFGEKPIFQCIKDIQNQYHKVLLYKIDYALSISGFNYGAAEYFTTSLDLKILYEPFRDIAAQTIEKIVQAFSYRSILSNPGLPYYYNLLPYGLGTWDPNDHGSIVEVRNPDAKKGVYFNNITDMKLLNKENISYIINEVKKCM